MAFDGTVVAGIRHELRERLLGGRIDKITQPEPDEIIIGIRAKGENHRLLLTANSQAPRVHLIDYQKQSPIKAPMFTMVLRKHISSGRIININQPKFERIIEFEIEALNEMGDMAKKVLLIELMGKHSNIILLDRDRIIDSIKHVPLSISSVRPVHPGVVYTAPPTDKVSPIDIRANENICHVILNEVKNPKTLRSAQGDMVDIMQKNVSVQKAVFQTFNGISPVLASEVCHRAGVDPDSYVITDSVVREFEYLINDIKNNVFSHAIYYDNKGKAIDISSVDMEIYSHLVKTAYTSPSKMLHDFYSTRDEAHRKSQRTADLRKHVLTLIERHRKKGFLFEKTLKSIENRDELKIKGEILTAYMYEIKKGQKIFIGTNFYTNEPIEIALDPELTPNENAQNFFKEYNKQKRTFLALNEQIIQNEKDNNYLESVLTAIENAKDEADILEIRAELAKEGLVKRRAEQDKKKKDTPTKPICIISKDGFNIYIGKNNTQNDYLTLRFASNSDIWLHTKDIPGSHVIIVTNGKEVPDSTILEAANLAVLYSKAKQGSNVPVDYVQKKHVKKPSGARPGYVIYDNHKTIYITPQMNVIHKGNAKIP